MSDLSIETTVKGGLKVIAEGNYSPSDLSVGQPEGIEDLEILWHSRHRVNWEISLADEDRIVGELLEHHHYLLAMKGRNV